MRWVIQLLAPNHLWNVKRSHDNIWEGSNAFPHLPGQIFAFRHPYIKLFHPNILQKGTRGSIISPGRFGEFCVDYMANFGNSWDEREFRRSRDQIFKLYIMGAGKVSHGEVEEKTINGEYESPDYPYLLFSCTITQ